MNEVYKFFASKTAVKDAGNGYTLAAFRADWAKLTDTDKTQLKAGIADGTLNY